ncbi:PspC domain-containing protein [Pseudonocardia sp. H11422]|uniref:PspC domain-containing protein n=1 Tax=Pseudonocardia sp. H11422 TaxID=2835866 RepID=UPI001BDCDD2F|nr:PspC domain-containing protein [Pseudonocardia sp. H11422]
MNGTDVQATLREMWETRPARPQHDRKVAGVAAAIARRYDIDPVLVRVGFVVAAFYGIGAALYIAGWVLLPAARADDPTDGAGTGGPGDDAGSRPSPHPMLLLGLVVAAIIGMGAIFGRDGGVVLPVLAVVVLLFLLHRSRGHRGIGGPTAAGTAAASPSGATADRPATPASQPGPAGDPGGDAAAEPARVTPPAWDPLGAAPFAWDLPEPSPPPPPPAPPAPRRPRVTAVTLALALLTGGVLGSLLLLGVGVTTMSTLFAIVLAIVGTGLVVGSFTSSGRGLIPVALLMCLLTWASVAAPWNGLRGGVGETRATPVTVAALAPEYHRAVGSVALDLRGLDLSVPPGADVAAAEPVRITLSVGMGSVQVWVPADADLTVRGSAGLGSVEYGAQQRGGPGATLDIVDDLGADGVRSGRPIVLEVGAGMGDVQVHRD